MIPLEAPAPPQPGEVLEQLLSGVPHATQDLHAERLGMSRRRLNEILRGKRRITAGSALRLARYLGNTPEFWLQLQIRWELHQVNRNRRLTRELSTIIPAGRERVRGMLTLLQTAEPEAPAAKGGEAGQLRNDLAAAQRQLERERAIREFLEQNGGREIKQLLRRATRHADVLAQLGAELPEEFPEPPIRLRLGESDLLAAGEDEE